MERTHVETLIGSPPRCGEDALPYPANIANHGSPPTDMPILPTLVGVSRGPRLHGVGAGSSPRPWGEQHTECQWLLLEWARHDRGEGVPRGP
jgi:hypothetical protein